MPSFKSDSPKYINITREASDQVIPTVEFLHCQEAVELIKTNAAMVGGTGKLDLGVDIANHGRELAIWKATRTDAREWRSFLDHMTINKIKPPVIAQLKRTVEDHFTIILNAAMDELEEREANQPSTTRELRATGYHGVRQIPGSTNYEISYDGAYRTQILELIQSIEDEDISDERLVEHLNAIAHQPPGPDKIAVQKFVGVTKEGLYYRISYIPLPEAS